MVFPNLSLRIATSIISARRTRNETQHCPHAPEILAEPPIKLALAVGLPLPGYALLETKGRKTGKPRRTPVGDGRIGNEFWLVAEHGMKAGYVRNIKRDPNVRLKLREGFKIRSHTGTANLLPDDNPSERQRWLATQLVGRTLLESGLRFW
jgi:deazaflavin-dependent oxidoreductase (nitroreductase family)